MERKNTSARLKERQTYDKDKKKLHFGLYLAMCSRGLVGLCVGEKVCNILKNKISEMNLRRRPSPMMHINDKRFWANEYTRFASYFPLIYSPNTSSYSWPTD